MKIVYPAVPLAGFKLERRFIEAGFICWPMEDAPQRVVHST